MTNWKEKEAAKAARVATLRAANPKLVAGSGCVTAAKNMRIELKAAFPGVKFSVKTSKYSGGNSITARWTDGPTSGQVDEIISKYAEGSFNGMDDSYSFNDAAWPGAFGGTRYVFTNRDYSEAAIEGAIRTLRAKYPADMADVEAKTAITFEAFDTGKLWNVTAPRVGQDGMAAAIGAELQRRTWALTKERIAKLAAAAETEEA